MRSILGACAVGLVGGQWPFHLHSKEELLAAADAWDAAPVDLAEHPAEFEDEDVEDAAAGVVGPHAVCPDDAPQYSGRLPAGGGAKYFFWLAEARNNTETAPLMLWLTGGPGCASTTAVLFENGPCLATSSGPRRNAHSWTEAANVVYVDQPSGVGFSAGPVVKDEAGVARHMVAFLKSFYKVFPRYKQVPFYIVGESYGGHYVPATAAGVLRAKIPGVHLAGVGIGNGLVEAFTQFESKPTMAFTGGHDGSMGHGVVDRSQYATMEAALPTCLTSIREIQTAQINGNPLTARENIEKFSTCEFPMMKPISAVNANPYDLRKTCLEQPLCYNFTAMNTMLNDPEVQRALGVPPQEFEMCNTSIYLPFAFTGDIVARFNETVVEILDAGVPVLVYNGDTDSMCDWVGSKMWVEQLQWSGSNDWAQAEDVPYLLGGEQTGLVRTAKGLSFMQIFNSGHMVPADQPEVALAMVREFMSPASRWGMPAAVVKVAATSPVSDAALVPAALTLAAAMSAIAFVAHRRRDPMVHDEYIAA